MSREQHSHQLHAEMRAYYNASEAYLADLRTHDRQYLEAYLAFVQAWVPHGSEIIEVGCGTGAASQFLKQQGYRAIGTDFSQLFLRQGGVTDTPLVCADALRLPLADGSVAAVTSTNFIEHVTNVPACLDEMWRVVAPGGRLLLASPNLLSPFFPLSDLADLLKGGSGRPVFSTSLTSAAGWLWGNTWRTLGKQLRPGLRWDYRQPDLTDTVVGGDADSVYLACPIDLDRHFRAKPDATVLQLSTGNRRMTRTVARWLPHWAPFIGLVVAKQPDSSS